MSLSTLSKATVVRVSCSFLNTKTPLLSIWLPSPLWSLLHPSKSVFLTAPCRLAIQIPLDSGLSASHPALSSQLWVLGFFCLLVASILCWYHELNEWHRLHFGGPWHDIRAERCSSTLCMYSHRLEVTGVRLKKLGLIFNTAFIQTWNLQPCNLNFTLVPDTLLL